MANNDTFSPRFGSWRGVEDSSAQLQNLNSAFTSQASGTCVVISFTALTSTTLTNLYVFNSAAPAGSNVMLGAIVANATGWDGYAGTSVYASTTGAAATSTYSWSQLTFSSPPSLTSGNRYAIVVHNASASPTSNYPQIAYADQGSSAGSDNITSPYTCSASTNGGSSPNGWQSIGAWAPLVLKFGDGTSQGSVCSQVGFGNPQGSNFIAVMKVAAATVPRVVGAVSANLYYNDGPDYLIIRKTSSAPNSSIGTGELKLSCPQIVSGVDNSHGNTVVPIPGGFTLAAGQSYYIGFQWATNYGGFYNGTSWYNTGQFADLAALIPQDLQAYTASSSASTWTFGGGGDSGVVGSCWAMGYFLIDNGYTPPSGGGAAPAFFTDDTSLAIA